jgi:hypothetical protein
MSWAMQVKLLCCLSVGAIRMPPAVTTHNSTRIKKMLQPLSDPMIAARIEMAKKKVHIADLIH